MKFQDVAGPYTMVSHQLANEVGLVCAAIYGAVWRHCQMEEGLCRASLNTIGKDINLDRATIMRGIEKLCQLGYLIDTTPGRRNAPHSYILGRSVALCNTSEDKSVVMRNSLEDETVAHNNTSIETVAECKATVAQDNATVAESHLNRVFKETSLIDNKERESRAHETHLQKARRIGYVDFLTQNELFAVKLSEICGNQHPRYVSADKQRELAESVAQLLDWDATIEQLGAFREKWKFDDDPYYSQVVNQWGRFLSSKDKPLKNGATTNGHNRQHDRPLQRTGEALEGEPTFDPSTKELVFPDGHRIPAVS